GGLALRSHAWPHQFPPQGRKRRPRARAPSQFPAVEHDPEKWTLVFGKRSCPTNKLERDDDSKKSHPALGKRPRAIADGACSAPQPSLRRKPHAVWSAP